MDNIILESIVTSETFELSIADQHIGVQKSYNFI